MKKINLFSKFLILALFICATNSNGQNINVGMSSQTVLPSDYFGFNSANTVRSDGNYPFMDDKWLMDSVANMGVGNLKFPPGSYGNFWDWHSGFIKDKTEIPVDDDFLHDIGNTQFKDNSFNKFKKNDRPNRGVTYFYCKHFNLEQVL